VLISARCSVEIMAIFCWEQKHGVSFPGNPKIRQGVDIVGCRWFQVFSVYLFRQHASFQTENLPNSAGNRGLVRFIVRGLSAAYSYLAQSRNTSLKPQTQTITQDPRANGTALDPGTAHKPRPLI
jgi:hypothetical protein